jgi:hypothetical protein
MKKLIAALVSLPLFGLQAQTAVSSFDDLQFWAGTGTNRAGFILQFGDGHYPASVAWGFRWNGTNSVAAMVLALAGQTSGSNVPAPVAGSDARLSMFAAFYPSFNDYLVDSFVLNQTKLPLPWSQTNRILKDTYLQDDNYPALMLLADADGQWTGRPFLSAMVGMGALSLSNGGWYAFAKADAFADPPLIAQPIAIPANSTPTPKPEATIRLTNGAAVISVPSQSGFSYQLAYSGLPGGPWTNQVPVLAGSNGVTIAFTNAPPGGITGTGQRFYRVAITQ